MRGQGIRRIAMEIGRNIPVKKKKNWRPAAIFRPLLPPLCIRDKKY